MAGWAKFGRWLAASASISACGSACGSAALEMPAPTVAAPVEAAPDGEDDAELPSSGADAEDIDSDDEPPATPPDAPIKLAP